MVNSSIEETFRALRTEARAPARSFAHALFEGLQGTPRVELKAPEVRVAKVEPKAVVAPNLVSEQAKPDKPIEVETKPVAKEAAPVSEVEFEKTLRSLEGFATKNSDEAGQVKFAGGSLRVKGEVTSFEIEASTQSLNLFEGEGKGQHAIKCAFIGHRLGTEWGEYDVNEEAEQMLSRMITAMKLEPQDYVLSPFKRQVSDAHSDLHWQGLLKELFDHEPRVVFLMGANVTATFMGKKERISKLHGQVIRRDFKFGGETRSLNLMPIFHPEYLLINSGMKRAAWEDFQRAMELMEK